MVVRNRMDEKLIELVRDNPELYNPSESKYSDNTYKKKIWRKISIELGKDVNSCKKRWESIRHQFRKVCRNKKLLTGEVVTNKSKWKYQDELSFLLPHMKRKKRQRAQDANEEDSNDDDDDEETKIIHGILNHEEDESALSRNMNIKTENNKRSAITQISVADSALMEYALEEERSCQNTFETRNELDLFFDSVKATVKKFSRVDVHVAKRRIFNVVSEMESKYLNIPHSQLQLYNLDQGIPYPVSSANALHVSNNTECL